ncbi:hypothetical protein [Leptolyngbya sp. FACHB-261]|uniref:hypothetical protein n=1 Tax=Leptolyngbya sp. FACHB-261 TaxID=2692806 RepID=UPI001688A83E|nr:hypothetical protein [Leptolyngbya sp. FACHB-261]MBD2100723.1 hypothetical protein [Leptolyngbya sp. FACHB-261]
MSNSNDREVHNREVRRDVYQDASGKIHTDVTRTSETIQGRGPDQGVISDGASYRNGYVQGRVTESRLQQEGQVARDNENAARGLLLGLLLTGLTGLVLGSILYVNQRNNQVPATAPAPRSTIVVPSASPAPVPTPVPTVTQTPAPSATTTIIERTREIVPVPQQSAPAQQAPVQQAPTQLPQQDDVEPSTQGETDLAPADPTLDQTSPTGEAAPAQ